MIRFGKIKRMILSKLAEILSSGGITQDIFISPYGIYSSPLPDSNCLIIPLANGNNQDIILALQPQQSLKPGDVVNTDGKSYILFDYQSGNITIQTNNLNIISDTLKHNGINVGDTHTHPQNAGDHFGGGVNTGSPE